MDKETNKLGYAVVGLGIGRAHMEAASKSERAYLAAYCDIREDRLADAKRRYPDAKSYRDFDELIRDPDVDVISICLPSAMHAEFAVRAMEAGKHVLIEKPIDITVAAAMKIEEARKRCGVTVGVVHQNRYNVPMGPMKEAVDSGRLGKLFLGMFAVKWYREQSYFENSWHGTWDMDGGGSLMNQSVHTVDLMQWLMGDAEEISTVMNICNHDIETEDLTVSTVKFKSGAVASLITTTCAYPGISTDIQLYGTKGTVEADADVLKTWKLADSDDEDAEEEEMLEKCSGNGHAEARDPSVLTGHRAVVEDMISAVLDGHEPRIMPLEAMKSVRIIEAAYESARTGRPVKI